ncbi:ATP-binding protein [Pseudanabaena sp. PCC 6802]|uniref:ATP-binding protein n=1 Tax=Pseudanabaena sp. PCC 6802 TaxID=118173 RepID=UPI00034994B4|nr:ATP-binding protein [Pseudanabaena sp. PCC 6802]
MTNPFTVGKPVALDRFIGRKSEVETAFDQIFSRSHLAIWGGTGMGKSSLLKYVISPEAWHLRGHNISIAAIARVNCLALEPFTAAKFWRTVLRSIQTQLNGEVTLQTCLETLLQKEGNTSDDVLALLRELGKCNRYLVLLADDYDTALRSNPTHTEEDVEAFLSECRSIASLAEERQYLSMLVTSSRRLSDISPKLTPDKSPWYNHYLFRQLKPLTESEVTALFAGMPITPAIQEGIREMAGGNPTLLQNAGYLLYEKLREGGRLDATAFANDFQGSTLQIFEAIWDLSTPLEQSLMMLVALTELQGKLPNKNFDLGNIKNIFSQKEIELKVLVERGILQQTLKEDIASYSFASSIMEWWVVKKILNSNDKDLQDRQRIFLNLMSHKQAEQLTRSIQWLWQNRDKVPSILEWVGKLLAAIPKGAIQT